MLKAPKSEPTLFQSEAEAVSWNMVNKIISLSISNAFKEKVQRRVPKECNTYLIDTLSTYINSQFISIDKEDDKNIENEKLPDFNNEQSIEKDNNTTQNIKINDSNNNTKLNLNLENIFFSNYYRGENKWDIVNEPEASEYDRYSSTLINYIIPDNKIPEIYGTKLEKVIEETPAQTTNSFRKVKRSRNVDMKKMNKSSTENQGKKKNVGEIMSKMSFHDISREEDPNEIFKDTFNLDELRAEKEIELKKKYEEERKILNALKKEEEKKKEENQLQKQYEKKKLTIDPNGDIIFVKGVNVDALSKEFVSIKSNMRMLKTETFEIPQLSEYLTTENLDSKDNKDNKVIKSDRKKRRSSLPKIDNREVEREKILFPGFDKNKNNLNSIEKKIERGPIPPSGSCFDRINLEIGVSMKENKKFKTGGKDFFIKYHKYSIETYNKKLKDTLSSNSYGMRTQYNPNYASELKKDYNFNESVTSNLNQGSQTSTSFKRNNVTEMNLKSIEMNTTLNPLIKLTGTNSLKSTMNDLDLITDGEIANLKQKRINIFKEKTSYGSPFRKQLNEMNQFTSTLLSNDKWGSGIYGSGRKLNPIKMPNKPLKNEIEREVGKKGIVMRKRGAHSIAEFSQSMRNFGINSRFNTTS